MTWETLSDLLIFLFVKTGHNFPNIWDNFFPNNLKFQSLESVWQQWIYLDSFYLIDMLELQAVA